MHSNACMVMRREEGKKGIAIECRKTGRLKGEGLEGRKGRDGTPAQNVEGG